MARVRCVGEERWVRSWSVLLLFFIAWEGCSVGFWFEVEELLLSGGEYMV